MFKVTRTSQPQQPVGIDWGNTNPLAVVISGSPAPKIYARGLAEPFAFATGSGVLVSPAAKGIGAGSDTSSTNTYRLHSVANQTNTVWEAPSGQVTVLVYLTRTGTPAGQSPIFSNGDTGSLSTWGIQQLTTTVRFDCAPSGGSRSSPVANLAIGESAVFVGVYDGVFAKLYKNGVLVGASASTSGNLVYVNAADRGPLLCNYYNFTGSARSFVGRIYTGALWNRALSDAEIKSLSDNPWRIFAPIERRIYFAGASGGTGNASGSFDAVTLTPPTATASGSASASGSLAAVSITGPTATASGGAVGNASGSLGSVSLAAPSATATGGASAAGSLSSVSITAPTATADASGTGNAFATFMALVLSPAAATASGGASATGLFEGISLTAPSATASGAVTETVGRPSSDTSNTGWSASTGSDLYAMVDEVVPDALDYIYASSLGAVCEMALNPTAYPGTASQQLKYRASSSTGNSVIVRLKEGATTIRTETQALTASDTEYTITLTSGEIAAITSGNLSVELESA